MPLKAYRFVGLDRDVYLPDDIAVTIDIVPPSRSNIRSNQRYTQQDRSVYHETGNQSPGANALSERNWLHSGAGGQYVGYNFAVDDQRIIQLTPLNEVTWHAGVASWNSRSWGVEQCVGKGVDLDRARRNAAALHGGLAEARGWNPDTAVVQHNAVYGKDCPMIIRHQGLWPKVQGMIRDAVKNAVLARTGEAVPIEHAPAPTYATPVPITGLDPAKVVQVVDGSTFYRAGYKVKAIRDTPRLRYANAGSESVGPLIRAGEEFAIDYLFIADDGNVYAYSPWFTRVRAADIEAV